MVKARASVGWGVGMKVEMRACVLGGRMRACVSEGE